MRQKVLRASHYVLVLGYGQIEDLRNNVTGQW